MNFIPVGPEVAAIPLLAEDGVVLLLLLAIEGIGAMRLLAEVNAAAGELGERSKPRSQKVAYHAVAPGAARPVVRVR